ncbi:MAG: UDPglucose 6-dehydrogenase [Pseudonocardiales bacterium]|jgi:UDPglucose 6-dehydrogenase|nr:UDPglucose 6-dehydrogenase [Pseudonocardiales bacterium]
MKLTVIGTGYLGATHAAAMAELGHEVLGIDTDSSKVARLNAGEVPFFEPGLPELSQRNLQAGRLRFTTSYDEIGAFGEVHFICVGTPQRKGSNAADLSYVHGSVDALIPVLQAGSVVVGKSTVPAGTAAGIAQQVQAAGGDLVWNPEFLREGFAVADTLTPDRVVLGAESDRAIKVMHDVYARILESGTPLIVTDFATAELVKVAANSFLATKISFINAMAEVCEATGADVTQLATALSHDERIGGKFLHAGLGFGGGCLPKDIRAFIARAEELGVDQAVEFLKEIDAINLRRRARMIDLARQLCSGTLAGMRVGVLGAAFKPNSDDIRDSPALDVAAAIQREGAAVRVYDPEAMANARISFPALAYSSSAAEACADADVVLHLTEWSEFRTMHPSVLSDVVRQRNIVDGRNALDRDLWRSEGWVYRALGRQ